MESSRQSAAAATPTSSALSLLVYWTVVGIPLAWGIWKTLLKLPALFQ